MITQDAINRFANINYANVYIKYKNVYTNDGVNVYTKNENEKFEKYTFGVGGYNSDSIGPEAALAYHLATDPELKDQQWFIVKYTSPGTNLDLHWRQNANLSEKMMDFVQSCLNDLEAQGYDVLLRSFLWMQGENDALAESCANNYATNEQNLVSAFRLKFAKYATRPNGSIPGSGISFITAGIAPYGKDGLTLWPYSATVNAAKVNNSQVWYVPGTLTEYSALYGLVGTSGMHFNANGAIYNSAYIDTSLMSTQAHDTAHYDVQSIDWLGTWFAQYVGVMMGLEGSSGSSGSASANKNTYTVTFNANGGNLNPQKVVVVEGGYIILPNPAWGTLAFLGWSDGTNVYSANAKYTPNSDVTLTAQWGYNTVTLNPNGGTCNTSSVTFRPGEAVTLPIPTHSQLSFICWFDGANYYFTNTTHTFNGDITLVALWQANIAFSGSTTVNNVTASLVDNKTAAIAGVNDTVTISFTNSSNQDRTVYVTVTDSTGATLVAKKAVTVSRRGTATETFVVQNGNVTIKISQS